MEEVHPAGRVFAKLVFNWGQCPASGSFGSCSHNRQKTTSSSALCRWSGSKSKTVLFISVNFRRWGGRDRKRERERERDRERERERDRDLHSKKKKMEFHIYTLLSV
jgi:hypothetical protein